MPKATVNVTTTERFELKTLPPSDGEEGGFVVLRRMSYGEFLKRRDMLSKMSMRGEGKNTEAIMEMAQEVVTRYEFQICIVDHNLEDDNGNNLDFRTKKGFTELNPMIGEEIADLIDEYNEFNKKDDEEEGPLGTS
ncbi:MAG: hypothetical protein LC687_03525 [Actinobacteria bacterium]|nr:hypothetical protein [Actinomycetota bacterium]